MEYRILIADDEPAPRLLMRRGIEQRYQRVPPAIITAVEDGQAAWEELVKARDSCKPYHLVLTDGNMPRLSGKDLLQKIKDDTQGFPELKMAMVSGDMWRMRHAQELGSLFLLKPYELGDLVEIVVKADPDTRPSA